MTMNHTGATPEFRNAFSKTRLIQFHETLFALLLEILVSVIVPLATEPPS